ncbi:type VI secretion system Vgr family protein [Uliginosibacterium aquaticum]|uniref:Type VI secretion system tip protein VgrG n=1 Tax=Uliginosibacterium aquaticum TaxID=2731212 RepID=A0ABX2ISI2_9RHOO|nr:type VI secretion system Vgr family protein [Uliginosibacterium aquaticum]NSL57090.1 type VI secretion system tip protein VgrG [Uliginosibacterium aquaticum]
MNSDLSSLADDVRQLLQAGHSDSSRLLRLHTADKTVSLLAERLEGVEEIIPAREDGAGFRFELLALSPNTSLQAADWLGQPLLIELLTAQSRTALRPLSGHITHFEALAADGAFGYYRLTVEPWLAFLAHRRDSYVFHDMSVIEIVESVFADYLGQASLNPAWRWALADASLYRKRSVCTQYRESDLAFVQRLMAEEGLYAWFEHASGASAAEASHTLVIADHMDALADNAQASIRFHRSDATEAADTIQHLVSQRALASHAVALASWDYRSLDARLSSAPGLPDEQVASMPLTRFDTPGAYAWPDRETGERFARCLQESIEAQRQTLIGESAVRSLTPGSRFTLLDHFDADAPEAQNEADRNRYAVIRVRHQARNNLGASLTEKLANTFGALTQQPEAPLYHNSFTLLPTALPWRAPLSTEQGRLLRPRPSVQGTQSAIVVGEAGQPVHTDRDGRIRLQFHWQRGGQSHSRLAVPSGEDNAPANAGSWSWVRVMSQWAGANWGASFVPRVGQEVLVAFIEGDIDRPVVVGSLYNGQGANAAQGNQVASGAGVATGNAPAWFAGGSDASEDRHSREGGNPATSSTGPGHAHPAVLAGFKTQAMSASQSGNGGFNQLVFDLTPKEPRTQLATTQFASSLNLGALRHQFDNQRKAFRGQGAELSTHESGALRAGSGLLLSTDARTNATGAQMDAKLAGTQLDAAHGLVKALAESAQKQKASLEGEAAPDKLAATEQLAHSQNVLGDSQSSAPSPQSSGEAGWSEPMITAESPAGIGALTPKDAILNTGNTLTLAAQDIHLAAQGKSAWAVKDGIALYTYGKASDGSRPVQDTGLKLHAAKGKLSVQAQSDKADFNADKKVTITSTTKDVLLQGKNDLALTAGGASIQISGGNITLIAPGKVELKGSQRIFTSAKSATPSPVSFIQSSLNLSSGPHYLRYQALTVQGEPIKGANYVMLSQDGSVLASGRTDAQGRTPQITTEFAQRVQLFLQDDDHQGYHVQPQEI